jgi:MHS family proline/betaine transporter-like MFS transporter
MKPRQLAATALGNILEWFDAGSYIYLSPFIGKTFFPHKQAYISTLIAFTIFAAGFLCRPLGSIIFGHFGDSVGRAKTLIYSILTMAFATLAMGLIPAYSSIGILAPFLFTFFRLIQGLSIGGEYSGVIVYIAESSPKKQRGFFTSFGAVGANLGFLLATILAIFLNTVFPETVVQAWGWRLPFILSGVLGFFILYARIGLIETAAYQFLKDHHQLLKAPLLSAFRQAPWRLLQILGLTAMGSTFYYICFAYMPNYLQQYFGVSLLFSLVSQVLFLLGMILLLPWMGMLGDKFGRKKTLSFTACGIILFALPCFYWLQHQFLIFIFAGLSIAAILSSLEQGSTLMASVENCPLPFRYSGVAFAYNLGNAVFGGTAPLMVSILTQKINAFAPAYYLMFMSAVGLVVVMTLKTSHKPELIYEVTK